MVSEAYLFLIRMVGTKEKKVMKEEKKKGSEGLSLGFTGLEEGEKEEKRRED